MSFDYPFDECEISKAICPAEVYAELIPFSYDPDSAEDRIFLSGEFRSVDSDGDYDDVVFFDQDGNEIALSRKAASHACDAARKQYSDALIYAAQNQPTAEDTYADHWVHLQRDLAARDYIEAMEG